MKRVRNIPLFIGGFFQQEYEGPDYGYENYEILKGSKEFEWVDFPARTEYKFKAFIDGTMKLYWIGNALKSGTPLFYGSIAVGLMYRTPDKILRNTTYTRNINLLVFPFSIYKDTFLIEASNQIDRFISNLRTGLQHMNIPVYTEEEIRENLEKGISIERVFSRSGIWIICDISYTGITAETNRLQVDESILPRYSEIKKKARSRVRQYMRLLEFFALKTFKERNPNSLVMVDGLYARRSHVKRPFLISDSDYDEITEGAVGFVKRPMEIPNDLENIYNWWEELVPGKAVIWEGNLRDKNEDDKNKGEPYKFALMRFRYFPQYQMTPAGIVKLQVHHSIDTEEYKQFLSAVYRERFPFPSSPKRFLNEPYPIEATERVAKSFFPPEPIIRGFISRYIPATPFL